MSKQKIREWLDAKLGKKVLTIASIYTKDELASLIQQYTQDQSGWVSVDERFPDEGEEVYMVTDGRYVNITEFDWEESCFLEIPNCALVNITHWMPLPLPPTEEA